MMSWFYGSWKARDSDGIITALRFGPDQTAASQQGLLCVCFQFFVIFYYFCEIQKLDGLKSEKLKAFLYELLSLSLFGPSSF
jgi:hypothetical protein